MGQQVTPAMVKELRERTGVGMSKCKEALDEAKGDMELAIANLRKAGMASAVKKEGRETKEGLIGFAKVGSTIAIVEINSETDFVAKNDRFKEFLDNIASEIAKTNPKTLESFLQQKYSKDSALTIDQYRATVIQAIGENIQIRRFKTFHLDANHSVGVYSHMNGKVVTAVEISNAGDQEPLAKEIAMHVAAASPEYLSPETVPQEIIAHERDIAKSQLKDKPANIMDKIIEGKINVFFGTNCLICQKYIKDDTMTISEIVAKRGKEIGKPLQVTDFLRWGVGQ